MALFAWKKRIFDVKSLTPLYFCHTLAEKPKKLPLLIVYLNESAHSNQIYSFFTQNYSVLPKVTFSPIYLTSLQTRLINSNSPLHFNSFSHLISLNCRRSGSLTEGTKKSVNVARFQISHKEARATLAHCFI